MKAMTVSGLRTSLLAALFLAGLLGGVAPANAHNRATRGGGGNRPYIQQDYELWWFNGPTPANYHTTANFTLKNRPAGTPIRWVITQVTDKINWDTNDTTTTTVAVKSVGASAAAVSVQKDITITVINSATGRAICSAITAVLTPDHLDFIPENDDNPSVIRPGFYTLINYAIRDQFNQDLPFPIALNEHWDIPMSVDSHGNITEPGILAEGSYVGNNNGTKRTDPGGVGGSGPIPFHATAQVLTDQISVAGPHNPMPVDYTSTDEGIPVDYFTGTWQIGGNVTGIGKQVWSLHWATRDDCKWHRYLGKGRHE